VLVFCFANAQKAEFGVKAGVNIASQKFSGVGAPSPSAVTAFQVGAFLEVKISDKFSIQPELLYSLQGSSFDFKSGTIDTKNTLKLAYINIPVMFKYYAAEKFSLEAGPQIGFLTSAEIVTEAMGQSVTQDIKSSFKSVDFGLNIGAGYDFTEKISAGVRYNLGLTNIGKNDGSGDSIKNNVFSITVGYKL
jgi:opacity protein-like surface antigen